MITSKELFEIYSQIERIFFDLINRMSNEIDSKGIIL